MTSLVECARFAKDVYHHTLHYPPSKHSAWQQYQTVNRYWSGLTGFKAALYLHHNAQGIDKAVISIRGTVAKNTLNLIEDCAAWVSDVFGNGQHGILLGYYHAAAHYLRHIKHFLQQRYPDFNQQHIILTGHSLGGAIAQCLACQTAYGLRCVTFNTPGIAGLIPTTALHHGQFIWNIDARYGLINKLGAHLPNSKRLLIDVPDHAAVAKQVFTALMRGPFHQSIIDQAAAGKALSQLHKHSLKRRAIDQTLWGILASHAVYERIISYWQSTQSIQTVPDVEAYLDDCAQNPKQFANRTSQPAALIYALTQHATQHFCRSKRLLEASVMTIAAQHSMSNILKALEAQPIGQYIIH